MGRKKKRKKQRAAPKGAAAAVDVAPPPPEESSAGAVAAPPAPAADDAGSPVARTAAPTEPPGDSAPLTVEPPKPSEPAPAATVPEVTPVEASQPSDPASRDEAPPAVDLDADLDEDDAGDYHSLVALVANMPDEGSAPTPRAGEALPQAGAVAEDDEVAVVDLDDDGTIEAVERLIAKAVVGAPAEAVPEQEPETPLIDLDADEPPKSLAAGTTPTAGVEAARLAAAAARGAVEEPTVPTFYLDEGGMSTPEVRARLLAEALAHAEHKEARYRVPIDTGTVRRFKGAIAAAILLLAGWVAVVPPGWVRPEPPAQITAATRARAVRTALYLQAQQVDAFRVQTQRLPASLDELPTKLPGIGYARSGNRSYQLIGYGVDGEAIIYDSVDPAPPFRALMGTWLDPDGAP